MQARREEERGRRDKEIKENKVKVKEVLKSDGHRLHQKYEEKYKRDFEMPELEEKKRQLEEIRKFFKPIPKAEMEEHAMRYERIRQSKNEESRRVREDSMKAQKEHVKKLREHQYVKITLDHSSLDSSVGQQEDERRLIEEKRKLLEKVRSYAKNVKEMYWRLVTYHFLQRSLVTFSSSTRKSKYFSAGTP